MLYCKVTAAKFLIIFQRQGIVTFFKSNKQFGGSIAKQKVMEGNITNVVIL